MTTAKGTKRYVALLRAINVGGHVVKMDALRRMFEELKLENVSTFIASGNVLFETATKDVAALERRISAHLEDTLGYPVAVFVRDAKEIAAVAQHRPFAPADHGNEENSVYVGFMGAEPGAEEQRRLSTFNSPVNEFVIVGREVYWLIRGRLTDSTFTGKQLEKTLGMPVTMRNVTTARRLAPLMKKDGKA